MTISEHIGLLALPSGSGCAGRIAIFIALLLVGGTDMARSAETLSKSIGTLSENRIRAEHWAAVLKGMQEQGELSKSEYRQGETYYIEGKASADSWLDTVLADLEGFSNKKISEGQKQALEEAALKAHTFMEYVIRLADEDQKRGWAKMIPDTITAVVDSGIKIWREFRNTGGEKRKALVARLEGLRWPEFAQIQAK